MEVKEVCDKIDRVIHEQLGESIEDISPYSHLKDDFGMDSLDDVELVMALEEVFDVVIGDEEAEKCKTVGDVYKGVLERLGLDAPKENLTEFKNCTFTSSDIFQQMLSIAKENNLFIQFDGFTQDKNDTIVVTHTISDTEYVVKDEAEFNKLVEALNVLNKFERK